MENETQQNWPLWKAALAKLKSLENFGYGMVLDIQWFERELGLPRDSAEFAFGLLQIRQRVESEHGYYIQTQTIQDVETGVRHEVAQIPTAADHEDVAKGFEGRMRSYAVRAVDLRAKTLNNKSAIGSMSDEEKRRMEKSMEIAGTRAVLLRREKSVIRALREHAPKLLEE